MNKLARIVMAMLLLLTALMARPLQVHGADYGGVPFVPRPRTDYARHFIDRSDGQQWFLDAVETILNVHAMSINTIASQADLDTVISVGLFDVGITGRIPRAIGELRNLQFLHLGRNNLSGPIPVELFRCTRLVEIDLSENSFTGPIPAGFGELTNLRVLLLWGNQLTGQIPAVLGELTGLVNLDLSSNNLTGGIPAALGYLRALRVLNLSDNNLGGSIPAALGDLAQLQVLMAWGCGLTGAIPDRLGSLRNLVVMDLSQNALTGAIPTTFSSLNNLREIALSDNDFGGRLPAEFSGLSAIRVLDLARNNFTGTIPASYRNLSALRTIDLDGNDLYGVIPDIWGNMNDLATAWLRSNYFVGDVPGSLVSVSGARVNDNYLYGVNVAQIPHNSGNFINQPAATPQFRLEMNDYVWAARGQRLNVYEAFRIVNAATGAQGAKPKLPVPMYEVVVVTAFTAPDNPADWFEITSDANGIFISLLQDVSPEDAILFELRMLPHDVNSPFSFVRFFMGTEYGQAPMPPPSPTPRPTPPPTTVHPPTVQPPTAPQFSQGESVGPAMPTRPVVVPEPPYALERRLAYITGTSPNLFEPNAPMRRVDIAVALFNIAGRPEVELVNPFVDIPDNHPHIAAIAWVYANDLMIGYRDGTFRPNSSLTRGELATLIVNWRGYTPRRTTTFPDAINHWANGSIGAIELRGHVSGYPDGTFRPNAPIRRAEVVTLLNSLIGRTADLNFVRYLENPFDDVSPNHWAFAEIMVAAVDHYVVILPMQGEEANES